METREFEVRNKLFLLLNIRVNFEILRLDPNGIISLYKETVLTFSTNRFNIIPSKQFIRTGAQTAYVPGRPPVHSGMNIDLLMHIPNIDKPKKSLWILFNSSLQMG